MVDTSNNTLSVNPQSVAVAVSYTPEPTNRLAVDKDKRTWQLWHCKLTDQREWRPLPSLAEAHAKFGGTLNP